MSPDKEKRLLEAGRAYEAAIQKAAELQEKLSKLQATEREVRRQFHDAAKEADQVRINMAVIATEDLPQIVFDGSNAPIARVHDLAAMIGGGSAGIAMNNSTLDTIKKF